MAKKAKYILSKLDGEEISLVPKGENGKWFFLKKQYDGDDELMDEKLQKILKELMAGDLKNEAELVAVLKEAKLDEGQAAALKGALLVLSNIKASDAVKTAVSKMLKSEGYETVVEKEVEVKKTDKELEEEKKKKANLGLVLKDAEMDPAIKQKIEKALKDQQDAVDASNVRQEKIEKELKIERDTRILKEFKERADEFKHLSVNSEEFSVIMKEMSEKAPDAFDKTIDVLRAADKLVGESKAFSEIGSNRVDLGGDTMTVIEKEAMGLVEKSNGEITKQNAISKFLETDRGKELYNKYENEQQGAQ